MKFCKAELGPVSLWDRPSLPEKIMHIWFQRHGSLVAYINIVNNKFSYWVGDITGHKPHQHGILIASGNADTLAAAKQECFKILDTHNRE